MPANVIDTWWKVSPRNNMCIGFVMTEGVDGTRKIYCGPYEGEDLNEDITKVLSEWGAPLREPMIFNMLKKVRFTGKFR